MTHSYSAQAKMITIAPKFTSVFSMMGSGYIIYDQLTLASRRRRRREGGREEAAPSSLHYHPPAQHGRGSTQGRLLLGMSTCDFIVSSCFFFTTWPIPSNEDVYAAIGNQTTCNVQGFFSQFSLAVALYNASLSVYYLTKIRFAIPSNQIRSHLEPWLHSIPLLVGVGTSTAGLFLELYNNDSWECWIAPLPSDCQESWKNHGATDCIRGDNASMYRWILYYAILWLAIVVVIANMLLVYSKVRWQERRVDRYDVTGSHRRDLSRRVAHQGYWYCGAFLATWIFPTITRLTQVITDGKTPYPLILITACFVPIQGFFNCIVYLKRNQQVRPHAHPAPGGSSLRKINHRSGLFSAIGSLIGRPSEMAEKRTGDNNGEHVEVAESSKNPSSDTEIPSTQNTAMPATDTET